MKTADNKNVKFGDTVYWPYPIRGGVRWEIDEYKLQDCKLLEHKLKYSFKNKDNAKSYIQGCITSQVAEHQKQIDALNAEKEKWVLK